MHRLGRMTTWLGVLITAAGVIAGFILLSSGQNQLAKFFLMIVPIGFLLLLSGVVTAFLANDPKSPVNPE